MSNIYVDVHVLQTVPPSCINRDDTGSPKTAMYGGVRRARVSSQAWKHAMRAMFRDELYVQDKNKIAERTKAIVYMVAEAIREKNPACTEKDSLKNAESILKEAGLKIKNADDGTDAMFFLSWGQARALADLCLNAALDKKERPELAKRALKENPSVDQGLFGRMVADDPSLNFDAASQVAHAISTHAVSKEYDYFTAVDDRQAEDSSGAAHLGTVEYCSATLYRYATVNVDELHNTLGDEVANTVGTFVESFVRSMPTGKQNTFANRTLPYYVYVTVRKDQPVNMVGAFEKPVVSKAAEGYAELSQLRLENFAKDIYENWATNPECAWVVCSGQASVEGAEKLSFKALRAALEGKISELLS